MLQLYPNHKPTVNPAGQGCPNVAVVYGDQPGEDKIVLPVGPELCNRASLGLEVPRNILPHRLSSPLDLCDCYMPPFAVDGNEIEFYVSVPVFADFVRLESSLLRAKEKHICVGMPMISYLRNRRESR